MEEINALTADPNLWDDPEKAQKLMGERNSLEDSVSRCREIDQGLKDAEELIEMGYEPCKNCNP